MEQSPIVHFPPEEYFALSRELEGFHSIFYVMWEMGYPVWDSSIETATVGFDEEGKLFSFRFNPDFWDQLSVYERKFLICHQTLHIILQHGYRLLNCSDAENADLAADLVVNHLLVESFGFERELLEGLEQSSRLSGLEDIGINEPGRLAWIDTVFGNSDVILPEQCFEYYHKRIRDLQEGGRGIIPIDVHDARLMCAAETMQRAAERLTPEEQVQLHQKLKSGNPRETQEALSLNAGTEAGTSSVLIPKFKPVRKKKWETIITDWARKSLNGNFDDIDQWAKLPRRSTLLGGSDLILPSEQEEEIPEKTKIEIWLFLDTSGSCAGYAERFWKVGDSLDPSKFNVRPFCFDTRVYETSMKSRMLYGFGGTSFACIERHIQDVVLKEKLRYPDGVFVITDGYGDSVRPEVPEKWHWFLTDPGSKSYIPNTSKCFELKNFE